MDGPLWGSSTRSVDGIGIPPLGSSQSDTWLSTAEVGLEAGQRILPPVASHPTPVAPGGQADHLFHPQCSVSLADEGGKHRHSPLALTRQFCRLSPPPACQNRRTSGRRVWGRHWRLGARCPVGSKTGVVVGTRVKGL